MRVLIRKEVDLDKNPNLSDLKPVERVTTAIRFWTSKMSMVEKRKNKDLNKEAMARREMMDDLKLVILYLINKKLPKDDNSVKATEIEIARTFNPVLKDTIKSADFLAYSIKKIEENADYLVAFPELPIILEVRRRGETNKKKDEDYNSNINVIM